MKVALTRHGNRIDPRQLEVLMSYMREDIMYEVSIKKAGSNRTSYQNRYMWGVVYPACLVGLRDLGWDIVSCEEVHYIMKELFASRDVTNNATGEIMTIPSSTASMSISEMCTYLDSIIAFSEENLNIKIESYERERIGL